MLAPFARSAARRTWPALLSTLVLLGLSGASAQDAWEMRACLQPNNAPMSTEDGDGFDVRIAEILADQLGARLTIEWTRFDDTSIERTLLGGACDLVIGIGEDVGGTISTVPYLRAPYVFVTREDQDVDVDSLDDEDLRDLRIGTYPTGVPSLALTGRGIRENVVEIQPTASPLGPEYEEPILDALVAGEIDVAIVYGPPAAERAARAEVSLEVRPVTPEVDVGARLLQLFRILTIGVRPHDESLRDRLNIALAERWEDVQAAIGEYGVPQLDIPRPGVPDAGDRLEIALVAPTASGGVVPLAPIGMAGLHGAEFAEYVLARRSQNQEFRVLHASAPTLEAAVRAAERLVATEDIYALVGGFGDDRAAELARIAARADVLFLNVGSVAEPLRGEACPPTTFHVEASESMYVDAAVEWLVSQGARRLFVVHEATPRMEALAERIAREVPERHEGGEVVGSVATEPQQFVYVDAVDAVAEAAPDAVLMLLRPQDQEAFLSQYRTDLPAIVTGLPYPLSQTREFLARLRDTGGAAGTTPRVTLWDPSIAEGPGGEMNELFTSRTGTVMDPTSWATYAAAIVAYEAATEAGSTAAVDLVAHLRSEEARFDVGKEAPLSFRAWDHQGRQPLYVVQVDPEAPWNRSVAARVGIAERIATLPPPSDEGISTSELDRFGAGPEGSTCAW